MPTVIRNQPTSGEVLATLAAEQKPVILSFSRGKDSIATWLALRDHGIEVIPFHLEVVPGLAFVRDSLAYYEDVFQTRILRYPHPEFWRMLANYVYQPPERYAAITAMRLNPVTITEFEATLRTDLRMPDVWIADGLRAADSLLRRATLTRYGMFREERMKVSPIADYLLADVRARLALAGVRLPPEYQWSKRSFDGLGVRYIEPIARNLPADYQRIRDWFPLIDLERFRYNELDAAEAFGLKGWT